MMHESPLVGDSEVILSEAPDNSEKEKSPTTAWTWAGLELPLCAAVFPIKEVNEA